MAEQDIVQNMISRLGQSQDERMPSELAADFFAVDDRDGATLLAQARALAASMPFYSRDPDLPSGDWSSFFPDGSEAALQAEDGNIKPHLGLFAAFLDLYRRPQAVLNRFTARHMDFQFSRVLRFLPKPARPDRAHVVIELKKGSTPIAVTPAHRFSAGKDGTGVELIYTPVRDTVIGNGKVEALHSVFRAAGVHFAPVANSADGLGTALPPEQNRWRAFGGPDLPPAPIGFALASPVLAMQEGTRQIKVSLTLNYLDPAVHTATSMAGAFEAYVTGPKGWLGPFALDGSFAGSKLQLSFTLQATDAAVVNYAAAIHGGTFSAQTPLLQLLLKPDTALRYADLANLGLGVVQIQVDVAGLHSLALENDNGTLNPKKAFHPFGPQPVPGSRFMIGSDEALSKHLLDLKVYLRWQGAPGNLYNHYANYAHRSRLNNGVNARLSFQDRTGQVQSASQDLMARDANGVSTLSPNPPSPAPEAYHSEANEARIFSLLLSGSGIGRWLGQRFQMRRPIYLRPHIPAPNPRSGFITVSLEEDFLHADYRAESIQHAVNQDKIVLAEPWTPTVQSISLSYSAISDAVDMGANDENAFASLDLQLFHVGCFGQRREHAFIRQNLAFVADKQLRLLPHYPHEGELLIGLSGLHAGDGVSLLFQAAEGSADPELEAQKLEWSVLCDNHWRLLTPQELVLDSSNELRTTGLVALTLPPETDTDNTWLPAGRVWLRAAIAQGSAAACQLIEVAANAVELAFSDQGNDPQHLAHTLPAGSLAKLKTPQAEIKKLTQPYAAFGGVPTESTEHLTRRSAERLRHRNRCITAWDYERMLLEAFPGIHRVKCIPHASEASWLAPGHVMLIAVPDLRNHNAVDKLRPRVDLNTLTLMNDYTRAHCGMQTRVRVRNPDYQRVRASFKVHFHPGNPFNFYRNELEQALIRALSPWAFDATREIAFNGRLYRSVLLDFVEELPYVDFVSEFKLGIVDAAGVINDAAVIVAPSPAAILVSDATHSIENIP